MLQGAQKMQWLNLSRAVIVRLLLKPALELLLQPLQVPAHRRVASIIVAEVVIQAQAVPVIDQANLIREFLFIISLNDK